jgi:ketosteroid isomerase-like protein
MPAQPSPEPSSPDQVAVRQFLRAFCEAIVSRDPSQLRPMLADDVEWSVFGPIDHFPFFGHRRGKDQVMDAMCRQIVDYLQLRSCEIERVLFDGDRAACLVKMTAGHVPTGRVVVFRMAQFVKFRDGKLAEMRAVLDSFDLIEQTVKAVRTTDRPSRRRL